MWLVLPYIGLSNIAHFSNGIKEFQNLAKSGYYTITLFWLLGITANDQNHESKLEVITVCYGLLVKDTFENKIDWIYR